MGAPQGKELQSHISSLYSLFFSFLFLASKWEGHDTSKALLPHLVSGRKTGFVRKHTIWLGNLRTGQRLREWWMASFCFLSSMLWPFFHIPHFRCPSCFSTCKFSRTSQNDSGAVTVEVTTLCAQRHFRRVWTVGTQLQWKKCKYLIWWGKQAMTKKRLRAEVWSQKALDEHPGSTLSGVHHWTCYLFPHVKCLSHKIVRLKESAHVKHLIHNGSW